MRADFYEDVAVGVNEHLQQPSFVEGAIQQRQQRLRIAECATTNKSRAAEHDCADRGLPDEQYPAGFVQGHA